MKKILLLILLAFGCQEAIAQRTFTGKPQYQIEVRRADTLMGKIVVELFPAIAPRTVANFDSLVEIHFYDSTAFHRVIPGFVIQGGDPNSRSGDPSTWGVGDPDQTTVDAEFTALSHRRGILSMARLGDDINSSTSQFFICVAPALNLDHKYNAFGRVVSGMDVVDAVVKAPTVDNVNNRPIVKISMFVTRLGSNDSVAVQPTLASPASGTQIGKIKQIVRWHKVQDGMLYHLQVANDAAFNDVFLDTNRSQVDTLLTLPFLSGGKTYYWRVQENNGGSMSPYSEVWTITTAANGVNDRSVVQQGIEQVISNSIAGQTTLAYAVDRPTDVMLGVYDVLGREVTRLAEGRQSEGRHVVSIAAGALPPGYYTVELRTEFGVSTRGIVVQ